MRTTLNIDDDILSAARELAERRGVSLGKALSDLARQALVRPVQPGSQRNGIPLFSVRPGAVVTTEQVRQLEDESFS